MASFSLPLRVSTPEAESASFAAPSARAFQFPLSSADWRLANGDSATKVYLPLSFLIFAMRYASITTAPSPAMLSMSSL